VLSRRDQRKLERYVNVKQEEPVAEDRKAYKTKDNVLPNELEDVLNGFVEEGYQVDGKYLVVLQEPRMVYFVVTGFDPMLIGAKHAQSMASMMGFGGLAGAVPGSKAP